MEMSLPRTSRMASSVIASRSRPSSLTLPDTIFVAATAYGTGDGGALNDQAPSGDANGDVERPEVFPVPLSETGVDEADAMSRMFLARPTPNPFHERTHISFFLPQPALPLQ